MIKMILSDYAIGFGGKYGVQRDRQDASALGWDHVEKAPAHASQVDHKKVTLTTNSYLPSCFIIFEYTDDDSARCMAGLSIYSLHVTKFYSTI